MKQAADTLYRDDPMSRMHYGDPRHHTRKHRWLRERLRGTALIQALEESSGESNVAYFAGLPATVDDLQVYPVVLVDRAMYEASPRIKRVIEQFDMSHSLVESVVERIIRLASRALYIPDETELGSDTIEIVRGAAAEFVHSILLCADYWFGYSSDRLLGTVSALPYEGRQGQGTIIIAKKDHPNVDVAFKLRSPVELTNARAVRKLLEASAGPDHVLSDGESVYGFGSIASDYEAESESIFEVVVEDRAAWSMRHNGTPLIAFRDGEARIPEGKIDVEHLADLISRVLRRPNVARLIELASRMSENEHGAMLIISSGAVDEAQRLSPQAWVVESTGLSDELILQLTKIDGATLVDENGDCHAIGVILDGKANGTGEAARGSRYNNASRYLDGAPPPAVVVVYSADGSIDILPRLRQRIERSRVQIVDIAFYLDAAQCDRVNAIAAEIQEWEAAQESGFTILEPPLAFDPLMDETYFI